MGEKKITNRDVFMEKLTKASTNEFIRLITCGKCTRCSNNFWDGNQTPCHKNINDSDCDDGFAEWLEASPGDNLQEKYGKKYWYFTDHTSAQLNRMIMDLLYLSGVVVHPAKDGEKQCTERCLNHDNCSSTSCYMLWQHIMNLCEKHVEELAWDKVRKQFPRSGKNLEEHRDDYEYYKRDLERTMRTDVFIRDVLTPRISDERLRGKMELLLEFDRLAYEKYKKEQGDS